jgi:hypothetical protein
MPDQVVELLSDATVWKILRKFANSMPCVGSQLRPASGDPERMDNAASVAMKLSRVPLVERVLWAEEASSWLRNTWQPAIASPRLGHPPNVHKENPALTRAVFRFKWSARMADAWARRKAGSWDFKRQWCLIVVELSACWWHPEYGEAFREWITGGGLDKPRSAP